MLLRLAVRLLVLIAIMILVEKLIGGIHISGGFWSYAWTAVLFSVVNLILGPIFRLLALPFTILTLGLFLLVVNAGLLEITAALSTQMTIDNFGSAILGALVISFCSWVADFLLPANLRRRRFWLFSR